MIYEGIVIEATKKDAVVMTAEKGFITIKNRNNLMEGDHVYFESKDIVKDKRPLYFIAPICASAAIFIFALILFFTPSNYSKEYAFIHMDINPSVEISINDDNEVIDIDAISDDADELLNGLNIKGETLSLAVEDLLEKSVELSLITRDKSEVLFSACLNDENADDSGLDNIFAILDEAVSNIKDAEIESYSVKADIQALKKANSYSLSMGRFMVYEKLSNSVSLEEVRTMPLDEIIKHLNEADNGDIDSQVETPSSLPSPSSQTINTPSPVGSKAPVSEPSPFAVRNTPSPYPISTLTPAFTKAPTLTPIPTTTPTITPPFFVDISVPSLGPTPSTTPSPPPSSGSDAPTNLIVNGDFSQELNGWKYHISKDAQVDVAVSNGKLDVTVIEYTKEYYDIFIESSKIPLTNGKTYVVEFDAYTTTNLNLKVKVITYTPAWDVLAGGEYELDHNNRRYSLSFRMEHETTADNTVGFRLEKQGTHLVLDNVKIYELSNP